MFTALNSFLSVIIKKFYGIGRPFNIEYSIRYHIRKCRKAGQKFILSVFTHAEHGYDLIITSRNRSKSSYGIIYSAESCNGITVRQMYFIVTEMTDNKDIHIEALRLF